jgi:hypothetical protein
VFFSTIIGVFDGEVGELMEDLGRWKGRVIRWFLWIGEICSFLFGEFLWKDF